MMNPRFWKNKRVFVTGHTGFKGSWLSLWLQEMGALVKGYALEPPTTPSLFIEARVAQGMESQIDDIRNMTQLQSSMSNFNPDILIHLAAQPLVRLSYKEPIETYDVNVMGTAKVLEAAKSCVNLKSIVSVTTDKCYENKEWLWGYRENEPMGGFDPYSSSKGCAELVTSSYRQSFLQEKGIGVATARAGNVIGGGDWAEDRLIPDILCAFQSKQAVIIRNPKSIRPWQHVLEPLFGYLMLAQKLYEKPKEYAEAWNFGPLDENVLTAQFVVDYLAKEWGESAMWVPGDDNYPHEANYLKLDCSKAKVKLGWQPIWDLSLTLSKIVSWQKAWLNQDDMCQHTLSEIRAYMAERVKEIDDQS